MIPGFRGQLVGPGDPGYDAARRNFNGAHVAKPELVALCRDTQDVASVVAFALKSGRSLRTRSSGHCVAGGSGGDGIILDLRPMSWVRVEGDIAHVGAATTFATLAQALRATGWHLPMGLCETVCVAGYTMGGGYGLTSRLVGMMADRAVGFTVLLADGSIVRADAQSHPDLFWALRGAGGGHLGVVLDLSLRLARLDGIWAFVITWQAGDMHEVLARVQHICHSNAVPDELGFIMNLGFHAGQPAFCLQGLYGGPREAGHELIRPLLAIGFDARLALDRAGDFADMNTLVSEVPYSFPECIPERFAYRKWGGYLDRPIPIEVWRALLDIFSRSPNPWSMVYLEPYGGAINRVSALETAFIHRASIANLVVNVFWDSEPARRQVTLWLEEVQRLLSPWLSGHVYQNYRDPWLEDHRNAYWGRAWPRLAAIKAKYDPADVFNQPQGIRLESDISGRSG